MKKIPPILQVPLKFGAAASLLIIILLVFLYYIGKHPLLIPIFVDFRLLLLPIFIFLSIKEFRDYKNEKILQFWQGMFIGLVCYIVIGLLAGICIYIFSEIMEPEFLRDFIRISTQQLTENKEQFLEAIGPEAYNSALEKLPLTTSIDLAKDYFLKTIVIGVFFTIIISVILRKQPKT